MNKHSAIQAFFSGFGLDAFPSISVPTGSDAPSFPYVTYTAPTDCDMGRVVVTASLWYRSTSFVDLNAKVEAISEAISTASVIECDEGAVIVRRGSPWAQPMGDDSDNMIKRKILTFEFMYATTH